MTKKALTDFLESKAQSHWDSLQSPYLLTDIPADFKAATGMDYKSILGEQRLKAFLEDMPSDSKLKLVQHPTQKAKIGLVPSGTNFSFPSMDIDTKGTGEPQLFKTSGKAKYATIAFLEAISKLPEQDQNEIQIPVRVIARLISRD